LLDRYGIPFFYEMPLIVHDRGRYRLWHPDFTVPQHGWLVVEYAGMPDVLDYAAGVRHKQEVYQANGIPALFLYPRDLQGPRWPERVVERLYEFTDLEASRLSSAGGHNRPGQGISVSPTMGSARQEPMP
jgi:hypothetical protein